VLNFASMSVKRLVPSSLRGVRPGWYVLFAIAVYALVVTVLLVARRPPAAGVAGHAGATVTAATAVAGSASGATATAGLASGLWFPIPGARLPAQDDHLPGAARAYRHGVSQGFDFFDQDAGVPVVAGTPVVAAQAGQVVRADVAYTEIDPRAWEVLMADVAERGADEGQLDQLRGRQVWLRLSDGTVLRYGHLQAVRDGIRTGVNVYRGQVIGFVGNSGTDVAVAGRTDQARLRFEVWPGAGTDEFFGAGLDAEAVRIAAASLFVGP